MEFKDLDQFRAMVKEEMKHEAIREVIKSHPKKNKWIDNLRHPLISVIIGFVLTGVVGTLLTNHFQELEKKRLLQREAFTHIREFSKSLNLRLTESRYLCSAIQRNVDNEILLERKKSYDDAVKLWNTNLWSHLLTFREYGGARNPIFIERSIEKDLIPLLKTIDDGLTEEFDAAVISNRDKEQEDVKCWIEEGGKVYSFKLTDLIVAADKCGYSIANLLFSFVAINLKITDIGWQNSVDGVQINISSECQCRPDNIDSTSVIPDYRTAIPWSNIFAM